MALRTTNAGLTLIGEFESNKLRGYRCPAGKPTIGRGMTSDAIVAAGETITYSDGTRSQKVIVGKSISAKEENRLFRAVVDHFENAIEALLPAGGAGMKPYEFDAFVSLTWNIGIPNFSKSSALRLFKRGDRRGAASQILSWNRATIKGRKVVVAGLKRRREAERMLFLGDYKAASAIARTDLGAMPQAVEEPEKREPISKSPTGNIQLGQAAGGATIAAGGVAKSVNDSGVLDRARDTAEKATDAARTAQESGLTDRARDVADKAAEAASSAQQLNEAAQSTGQLFGMSGSTALIVFGGLVVVGLAAYGWWRRRQRSRDEESLHLDYEEVET